MKQKDRCTYVVLATPALVCMHSIGLLKKSHDRKQSVWITSVEEGGNVVLTCL